MDGVVRVLTEYRRIFSTMGHEVYIFAPGSKTMKKTNTDPYVYYFTSAAFKPYPDYKIALFPFPSAIKRVKETKPHIVHSHGIATTGLAAIQAADKIGVPKVATFHTLVTDALHYITPSQQLQPLLEKLVWKYLKWYYGHFSHVIAPSHYVKRILNKHGINNVIVMPSGINVAKFQHAKKSKRTLKRLNITKDYVLFVGRVAKEKKLEQLIDAFTIVLNKEPQLQLVIAGKGPALNHYKELVKKKGLADNVVFTGFVDDNTLPSLYYYASAFAFPSQFDTQGLVVLEAMACGTPVVTHKDSAAAEFVNNISFTFSTTPDLADKLIKAIESKDSLKEKLQQHAQQYDVELWATRLLTFYRNLI